MEMDAIDTLAAKAFDGFIVRKDLVRRFKNQYPVPTYVVEFLLGRYCASVDEQEIQDGLQIVQRQLVDRAVRAGTEELFKSRAREKGAVKIIDLVTARLDVKSDAYVAELPSLRLRDVRIDAKLVQEHDRMLTGGFYAEIELSYDATIAQENSGRPFGIATLREIQLSKRNVLDTLTRGRSLFTTAEWKQLLIRSIGLEPEALSPRAQDIKYLSKSNLVF
jgi:ATP-dependent Lon protease